MIPCAYPGCRHPANTTLKWNGKRVDVCTGSGHQRVRGHLGWGYLVVRGIDPAGPEGETEDEDDVRNRHTEQPVDEDIEEIETPTPEPQKRQLDLF